MSKNYALVIGNGYYDNKEKFADIPYCLNDAKEVFRILTKEGFSIFSPENSILELDVTVEKIPQIFETFFSKIDSGDLVLIYFAGHGKVIGSKTFHFVMKNTQTNNRTLAGTSFNIESILPYFFEKNIDRYILIIDACYAGKVVKTSGFRDRGEINEFEAINEAFSGEGKIVIASAADYQVAKETETLNHGLFSFYFIEGIEKGNCAKSKWKEHIEIKEAFDYSYSQLRKKHRDIGQIPIYSGQHVSGSMWIAKNPAYVKPNEDEKTISALIADSVPKNNQLDKFAELLKKREKLRDTILEIGSIKRENISMFSSVIKSLGEALGLDEETIKSEIKDTLNYLDFGKFILSEQLLEDANGFGSGSWFSTLHGSNAMEIPEYGYGVFSYFLREALSGKAADDNGIVTLDSAYKYVEARLPIGFGEIQSKQMSILISNFEKIPILTAFDFTNKKIKGKREGLFIGIDNYLEPNIHPLHCAEKDARAISTVLKNLGSFNCINLFGANATKKRTIKTIKEIIEKLSDDDMFMFYFSGHGFSTIENGHIVMYDTNNSELSTTISLLELAEIKSKTKAKTVLFVFDCCLSPINI